jgi:hypothetical protein
MTTGPGGPVRGSCTGPRRWSASPRRGSSPGPTRRAESPEGRRRGRPGPAAACAAGPASGRAARRRGHRPPAVRRWGWRRGIRRILHRHGVLTRQDQGRQASEGRQGRAPGARPSRPRRRRRGPGPPAPAAPDARASRSAAGPGPGFSARPPGRPGSGAGRSARRPAGRRRAGPRSASTTPTRVRLGKVVALGRRLGGHEDVDLARRHRLDQGPRPWRPARCRTRTPRSARPGRGAATSSSTRSTPGPIETSCPWPRSADRLGLLHGEAGQVADQPAGVAMLDQPAVGVRRGHPVPQARHRTSGA